MFNPLEKTLSWPQAQPSDNLDYSLRAGKLLACTADTIALVTMAVKPSGAGELAMLALTANADLITAQLAGGVAGRTYTVSITATASSGRVAQWLALLPIDATLAASPLPAPPSLGFGTPLNWTPGVAMFGTAFAAVATGLDATGTTQATATLLAAQTNVFTSGVAGGGCVLNPAVASGTLVVTNAWTGDILVWPVLGAQIGSYGANVAVAVAPGQTVGFVTSAPATQWYAT